MRPCIVFLGIVLKQQLVNNRPRPSRIDVTIFVRTIPSLRMLSNAPQSLFAAETVDTELIDVTEDILVICFSITPVKRRRV